MTTPFIRIEIEIGQGDRRRKFDRSLYGVSPRKWRVAGWRGDGNTCTKEAEARALMATWLRGMADHIEQNAFPKPEPATRDAGALEAGS
jgi:hypothetical protein